MKNFPVEVQLDILKFFDYKQLYSFQLINKQLNKLINKYNNELTLKRFFRLEMRRDNHVNLFERNQALDIPKDFSKRYGNGIIYNNMLNDSQKIKWESALNNQIPLFLFHEPTDKSFRNYVLFIKRRDIDQQLCLELPVFPKNVDELKFIRFWLFQLSLCCFQSINFGYNIFNPEMLKILLEDSENQNIQINKNIIQFYCENARLSLGSHKNNSINEKSVLDFIINYLISNYLQIINIKNFNESLLNFSINYGNKVTQIGICDNNSKKIKEVDNLSIVEKEYEICNKNGLKIERFSVNIKYYKRPNGGDELTTIYIVDIKRII